MENHSEVVHVAVAPPRPLVADLTKKVAAVLSKDPYDVRLHLVGDIPRIIAHYERKQEAESTASSLRDLGLVAFVCEGSELRQPSLIFNTHTIEFGDRGVLFQSGGGEARRVSPEDVLLILKGRIQTDVETVTTKTKAKLNLTATLLTGIPVRHRVTEKTKSRSFQSECFARIYDRDPTKSGIEVLQHGINYSSLGTEMAYSSLENFDAAVARLREAFPRASFDDSLMKPHQADLPCAGVDEALEINCRLIYLYNLARVRLKRQDS